MKTINVYQSELNKEIPLEYIGKVKYIGPDDPLSFINEKEYYVVRDRYKVLKVVDETEEDYVYDLTNPDNLGGKFYYIEDSKDILKEYISEYR